MRAIEAQAVTVAHWSEQAYQRVFSADSSRLALVYEDGAVQGFVVASQIGADWELENLVVVQQAQRRGVGSALLDRLMTTIQQHRGESVFLEVRASNVAARAFYEKHGFQIAGRRRGYYQHPAEDAVLYRKIAS